MYKAAKGELTCKNLRRYNRERALRALDCLQPASFSPRTLPGSKKQPCWDVGRSRASRGLLGLLLALGGEAVVPRDDGRLLREGLDLCSC